MTKTDEIQIRKKTGDVFTYDQIPSIYSLVRRYMTYQVQFFGRNLNMKKALDEFMTYIYQPLYNDIVKDGEKPGPDFYRDFFSRAYQLLHRDRRAERNVRTHNL